MSTLAQGFLKRHGKPAALWGDGLVEQSLSTMWYPSDWDDVDGDELIFFMPGLAARTMSANGAVAAQIHDALGRRLYFAQTAIAKLLKPHAGEDATGVLALTQELAGVTPGSFSEIGADNLTAVRAAQPCALRQLSGPERLRAEVVYDLCVVNSLDRMLQGCRARAAPSRGAAHNVPDCPGADALVASIHSGINAAYVYPHLTHAHETLSAGAWLGVLLSKRPALLPPSIAAVFVELYRRMQSAESSDDGDAVLAYHALQAVGQARLHRQAQRALKADDAVQVRPRWLQSSSTNVLPPVWNVELAETISRRISRHQPQLIP